MKEMPDELKNQQPQNNIETELSRDLGLTSALAIGIGTMIAAGIFSLSDFDMGRSSLDGNDRRYGLPLAQSLIR